MTAITHLSTTQTSAHVIAILSPKYGNIIAILYPLSSLERVGLQAQPRTGAPGAGLSAAALCRPTLLAANDDYEGTTDYSSRVVWQAPAGGVYYLRTTNRAELTGCHTDYDLWREASQVAYLYLPIVMRNEGASALAPAEEVVEDTPTTDYSPAGIISHMCLDDYELDDTWQQAELAGPIEGDVVQVHSFDSDPDLFAADKDFVGFDVLLGGAITFTLSTVTNTSTLMELYDALGAALGVTDTVGPLVWTGVPAGRYYPSVSPLTTDFGCANDAGYVLQADVADVPPPWALYLRIVLRP